MKNQDFVYEPKEGLWFNPNTVDGIEVDPEMEVADGANLITAKKKKNGEDQERMHWKMVPIDYFDKNKKSPDDENQEEKQPNKDGKDSEDGENKNKDKEGDEDLTEAKK